LITGKRKNKMNDTWVSVIQCREESEENAATRRERGKVEEWKLFGARVLQS
jgi:hypothetical protein